MSDRDEESETRDDGLTDDPELSDDALFQADADRVYAELLALQASATKKDRRRLQLFDIRP